MISDSRKIHFLPESYTRLPGLQVFEEAFPEQIGKGGTPVEFRSGRSGYGFSFFRQEEGLVVDFSRPCDAFRALGLLLGKGPLPPSFSQEAAFESVGVMWDLSRNAVLRLESMEALFRSFALMGVNSVQLYMEDVYEIPDEPFFGYCRGAYSQEDLRRIDSYGHQLGIEVIASIQTLGHLEQVLQWPAYADCVDVSSVLLVGEEKTRDLIGKMLDAVAGCFRSRTIHVGMDEAFGVGTGKYQLRHGFVRPFDILNAHLQMVGDMCRERGLTPMIWSDMFFRIGSSSRDYYDRDCVIPSDVASKIPPEVELVYWDYYSSDTSFYEEWIQRHRVLGKEPVFAASVWSHGRFWAYAPRWRESIAAGMKAARRQKVKKTFVTVWFDDGAECLPPSVLPALLYFAEWAYSADPDMKEMESRFSAILSGSSLQDYLLASDLDDIPAIREAVESDANYAKWILWHDPVLGFLELQLTPDLPRHYHDLAAALDQPDTDGSIRFARQLACALSAKTELHLKARASWRSRDFNEIRRLQAEVLPDAVKKIHELWDMHRVLWRKWNKPFGWEVLDQRYAGCIARLQSLSAILQQCLQSPEMTVPEWEVECHPVTQHAEKCHFRHGRAFTPSALK